MFQASLTAKQAYRDTQRIASVTKRQRAADYVSAHGYNYTFTAAAEPNTAITRYFGLLQQALMSVWIVGQRASREAAAQLLQQLQAPALTRPVVYKLTHLQSLLHLITHLHRQKLTVECYVTRK